MTYPFWNKQEADSAQRRFNHLEAKYKALEEVFDNTSEHWLDLQKDIKIPWEGALDSAMLAACDKIRDLQSQLDLANSEVSEED